MERLSRVKMFGGWQERYRHASSVNHCEMSFSIYLPPQAEQQRVPVLYWLSGLTCNDENFVIKAGAQRYAAEHGIALVAPDTSPRGEAVPDDPEQAWDFGLGAGFYVNATEAPWADHYQMYSYIVEELPELILQNFNVDGSRQSISGHSMGGHGALTIALKNPQRYCSVSAFAPIVAPMTCPWGEKAFSHYLGDNRAAWQNYDSCELVSAAGDARLELLIDQGMADDFLESQLQPEKLERMCQTNDYPLTLRRRQGYDHSYYFIASFIGEHIAFHARALVND